MFFTIYGLEAYQDGKGWNVDSREQVGDVELDLKEQSNHDSILRRVHALGLMSSAPQDYVVYDMDQTIYINERESDKPVFELIAQTPEDRPMGGFEELP